MRLENSELLSPSVLLILWTYAFFDNCCAVSFILHPIRKCITTLELRNYILADYFLRLARLDAAIKKLPTNDYQVFRRDCIQIFNNHFAKFDDDIWLVCFFLHSGFYGKLIKIIII